MSFFSQTSVIKGEDLIYLVWLYTEYLQTKQETSIFYYFCQTINQLIDVVIEVILRLIKDNDH